MRIGNSRLSGIRTKIKPLGPAKSLKRLTKPMPSFPTPGKKNSMISSATLEAEIHLAEVAPTDKGHLPIILQAADFIDPFEIFEQFFGGGFSRGSGGRGRRQAYQITIDFMEAVKGVTKEVHVPRGAAGDGSLKKTIKIPAGVDTGSRIRFDDFDIVLEVRPDRFYKREGVDLIIDHAVTFSKAALGTVEEVPTIDGPLKIRIQAGTQPDTMLRLRGKGVPHLNSSARGDQYVRIKIHIPSHLTHEQKELLEQLDESGL